MSERSMQVAAQRNTKVVRHESNNCASVLIQLANVGSESASASLISIGPAC